MTTTKTTFDFCIRGPKDLDRHNCPGRYQKFYHGKVKRGRKSVDSIIWLDEFVECDCLCHIPKAERPKRKRKKRK